MVLFLLLTVLAQLVSPTRVTIPAGSFTRGSATGEEDERPKTTLTLARFEIDRTEVTRGAYAACIAARLCRATPDITARDLVSQLPMTQVSWRDAHDYCAAVGARLPTEAEWERAARGAKDERLYPWGDEPDCSRANFGNFEGEGRCPGSPGHPVAVGSFPSGASPEGVHDLAGNVWEWTADYYAPNAYARAPSRAPRGPARGLLRGREELGRAPRRSVRGGACCSMFGLPRVTNRVGFPEDYRDDDLGFRCAK